MKRCPSCGKYLHIRKERCECGYENVIKLTLLDCRLENTQFLVNAELRGHRISNITYELLLVMVKHLLDSKIEDVQKMQSVPFYNTLVVPESFSPLPLISDIDYGEWDTSVIEASSSQLPTIHENGPSAEDM